MPYNTIVRSTRYQATSAMEAARLSAFRAVQMLLEPVPGLSVAHRRELLTTSLWKWTEAVGVAPHPKFNVRYATPAALDHSTPTLVNHEHVWPRKWIIDRLLEPGKTWAEDDLRAFLEQHGVACVVTVEEHAKLGVLGAGAEGWERYAKAGLRVRDLAGDDFLEFGRPGMATVVDQATLATAEQPVVLDPGEEPTVASPGEVALTVGEAFDRFSGDQAPLLKRLLETADLAGGVGLVGRTKRPDAVAGAYVRIHDATLPEPTRAVAFVHWSGKVSLALSTDELPVELARRPGVGVQTDKTYGVSCKVSDEGSLATAQELVASALEKVRLDFGPIEEDAGQVVPLPSGHVFVIQGRIGEVVADAAIVSTDNVFKVENHWRAALGASNADRLDAHRPDAWAERGWGRSAKVSSNVWFVDVTAAGTGGGDAFDRLRRALDDIASAGLKSTIKGRPLPLVVLPVIGTKGGGFDRQRGGQVKRLLDTCRAFVEEHAVDIAIVSQNRATSAALQYRRLQQRHEFFGGIDLTRPEVIGAQAREGSLALFIGAGTSIPAGAPSWDGLLRALLEKTDLGDDVQAAFKDLSALDQAQLLHANLGDTMGVEIRDRVERLVPALAHVLLANLRCEQAVTTNYDHLYERAIGATGARAATILPTQVPPSDGRWLLKLHGDMTDPKSIVLTRAQFVDFTSASGPAGAVVQALLLTKHLLIVGASMNDDNVLRLIYEVAAYRERVLNHPTKSEIRIGAAQAGSHEFGTILSLTDDAARAALYAPYFDWEVMPGAGIDERARQLEVFLDAAAMFASTDHSWLLDERFGDLLEDGDRELVRDAQELASKIRRGSGSRDAWRALLGALEAFGERSKSEQRQRRTDDSVEQRGGSTER